MRKTVDIIVIFVRRILGWNERDRKICDYICYFTILSYMKKILGLDLGTSSIGWALVNEAENDEESSSIVLLGVRIINYDNFVSTKTGKESKEPEKDFAGGKGISPNAGRTLKRSMRRNLQRYKLRRENLIEILKEYKFISNESILSENGNRTTFETYRLRAKAAKEEISLEQFARVLLMINKKRGYKSSRKAKNTEEGTLIDGIEIAEELYDRNLTPGEYCLELLRKNTKALLPDFYRSDLQTEFNRIWEKQKEFYPDILIVQLKENLQGKNEKQTWAICREPFGIVGAKRNGDKGEQEKENYEWRAKALNEKIDLEYLAIVLQKINSQINGSSGYLGKISDRSKELYFNKQTVGQYLMAILDKNSNTSLRNMIFYRQDYLDEFETLWSKQAEFHIELTETLKKEIRDVVIFYQRKLKSQKNLISFCEFENRKIEVEIDGKKKIKIIGNRVIPRSSPLFQEFKIWQILNNIEVTDKNSGEITLLSKEEKEKLFAELQKAESLSTKKALEILFEKRAKNYSIENYKEKIEGNKTRAKICEILNKTLADEKLNELWHLLYSWESENSNLAEKLEKKYVYPSDIAKKLSNITFLDDYGNLSARAIKKILPHLKNGKQYNEACELAGYAFSKSSLTKEQIENKILKNRLEILPKNSLRNPVVEKILNQMVNVINSIIDIYGKPDEIRIELARELKKGAKEREEMAASIAYATKENERIKKLLQSAPFNIANTSKNDIIRYKLYEELASNSYRTLYSNTYIPQESLFTKDFDIEHIIPQSRLFDDSFSNKTLEKRQENIEKGNSTAYDWMAKKGEKELADYEIKIKNLFDQEKISRAKYNNLKRREKDIPDDFIDRDIRDTQYIAKKAREMLQELVRVVVPTTGSVTAHLREDWQLVNVMQELNFPKYERLGLVEEIENKDGQKIKRIKEWTKRNDHRHHAMDALTVAFTKYAHIQFFNHINSHYDSTSEIYGIKQKYFTNDNKALPPIPLKNFRVEAKKQLEKILVSIKAKNKVVTTNINKVNNQKTLTPRGQLHNETIYGSQKQNVVKEEAINAKFNEAKILTVTKLAYREALLKRLRENENDPKKAFTGKNSLAKNPIYLDNMHTKQMPEKVKTVTFEIVYTIRKPIDKDLNVEKVVDVKVREILKDRLNKYNNDPKEAFVNIKENPIWLNEKKRISIKYVTIFGVSNVEALHDKHDKDGNKQPVGFVSTSNNHHVAIYRDEDGNLQENVVSFYDTVKRANAGLPVIDKEYKQSEGWQFLFTMKQNEYFVFSNEKTGFDPKKVDLMNPENYHLISPNLFRVQKIASKNYMFRHHLETKVSFETKEMEKQLRGIAWELYQSTEKLKYIVKIRVNHIGQIIQVGEY